MHFKNSQDAFYNIDYFSRPFVIKVIKFKKVNNMKEMICKVFAHFLYRGMKVLYKRDDRVKAEVDAFKDGAAFALKFSPERKACVVLEKTEKGLKKRKSIKEGDNVIEFKTLSLAVKTMTGQKGLSQAYAQHDFILKGSINEVMGFTRVVEIVMAHLLPKFMLKKILREVPKRKIGLLRTYILSIFGV